jgi:hypothetical protein
MENIIQTEAPGKRLSLGAPASSRRVFPGARRSRRFNVQIFQSIRRLAGELKLGPRDKRRRDAGAPRLTATDLQFFWP